MKPCVITAIFGQYDSLKEVPEQSIDCDYLCATDDEELLSNEQWKVVHPFWVDKHPRLKAKWPKFKPWDFTEAEQTIWIDASAQITSPTFVEEALEILGDGEIAQFQHPWRDCIYEEAEASKGLAKYEGLRIGDQVEHYAELGHPAHWGLWATGVIARNRTELNEKLGHEWWSECYTWTYQDQLSEAPILRELGMRPIEFPHHLVENPWMTWMGHASEY